jgi:hypothetical protein
MMIIFSRQVLNLKFKDQTFIGFIAEISLQMYRFFVSNRVFCSTNSELCIILFSIK